MSRRFLASLALGLFSLASVSAAEGDSDSPPADEWVGRKVLTKSADVVLHEAADEKSPVVALSTVGIWLNVKKVENGWLQTEDGWVRAETVVRDDQAVEYFTRELKRTETAFAYISRSLAWLNDNEIDKADADASEALRLDPRNVRAYFARAAIAAAQQRADPALAAYDRALEIDPRDPVVLAARAQLWAMRREYDRAIADLDLAIDVLPRRSRLFVFRAYCWEGQGDKDRALADFSSALQLDPNDAYSLSVRAGIYFQKQEFDKASREAERAIELDATKAYPRAIRGAIRAQSGELDGALADLDESIRLDPTQPFAHSYRGMVHYRKGEYDAAIRDLTQAISLDPDQASSYFRRAQAWSKNGDQASAVIDFTQCLKLQPENVEAYVARGQCRLASSPDEAMQDFEAALRLNPKHVGALVGQAEVWNQKGKHAKAVEALTAAINVAPGVADFYERRARRRMEQGEHDLAIDDLTAALKIDPKDTGNLFLRSMEWSQLGELEKAIDDCRAALAIDPKDLMAYYYLAMAHSHAGQKQEALKDFDAALKIDPENFDIRFLRDYELYNQGRFDLALADLNQIIEGGKHAADAYGWRGYFWFLREKWEKAAADYSEAIHLGEKNATLLSQRAHCWVQLHQIDKAIQDADEALRLDPKSEYAGRARQEALEAKDDPSRWILPRGVPLESADDEALGPPEAGEVADCPNLVLRGPKGFKLAYPSEIPGEFGPESFPFPVHLPLMDEAAITLKLTGDTDVVLYVRLEAKRLSPQDVAVLRATVPTVTLIQADLDAASGGEVTKALVLHSQENEADAKPKFEVVSSTDLAAGANPVEAAGRRGTLVATLRIGKRLPVPAGFLPDERLVVLSLHGPKGLTFTLEVVPGQFEDRSHPFESHLALSPDIQIRFKLSGPSLPAAPVYGLLTLPRERPPKADLPPETELPITLSDADLKAATEGKTVTRVVYLAARATQKSAARVETLTSAQMDAGKDRATEVSGRGTILATIKLSRRLDDLRLDRPPAELREASR